MNKDDIVDQYDEICKMLDMLKLDAHKFANGTRTAGLRFRKGLRVVRKKCHELVMSSIELDKEREAEKKLNA